LAHENTASLTCATLPVGKVRVRPHVDQIVGVGGAHARPQDHAVGQGVAAGHAMGEHHGAVIAAAQAAGQRRGGQQGGAALDEAAARGIGGCAIAQQVVQGHSRNSG
jgi:hypothetical protein